MVKRVAVLFAIIVCIACLITWFQTPRFPTRQSIVFIGEPMVLVSWEPKRSYYTMFAIPSDMMVEALHGYGSYSLSSLWKLDTLEKRHGTLFLPSLVENFALPVQWYSMHKKGIGTTSEEIVQFVKQEVSFASLLQSVVFRFSSLAPMDVVRLWMATRAIDASSARVFDFRTRSIGSSVLLPDGSTAMQFDQKMYDGIVGDSLESVELRYESIRLALYNTTTMPGIGSRVARVIERLGGYVVFVGNDDVAYDGLCELKGSKERLLGATSKVIQSLYGCTITQTSESLRGDVILRLGKVFEKRYLPF